MDGWVHGRAWEVDVGCWMPGCCSGSVAPSLISSPLGWGQLPYQAGHVPPAIPRLPSLDKGFFDQSSHQSSGSEWEAQVQVQVHLHVKSKSKPKLSISHQLPIIGISI